MLAGLEHSPERRQVAAAERVAREQPLDAVSETPAAGDSFGACGGARRLEGAELTVDVTEESDAAHHTAEGSEAHAAMRAPLRV
jgi:hypothetical protein